MRRKLYKHKFAFVGIIILILFSIFIFNLNHHEHYYKDHRLEWWLKSINWNDNRAKYDCSGKNVKIAVIDSGVDNISEFSNNVIEKINLVKGNGNCKHGNAICSIICGNPQNEKGVLGVAPQSDIISIDVTDDEDNVVDDSKIVDAINIAIDKKVDIINLSIGIKRDVKAIKTVVEKAYENGIVIVASAGNYMTEDMLYPAKYNNVIAVGSLDKKGHKISPITSKKNLLYLPGENIVTTIGENKYAGVYGTSFSTAICTGIISLLIEKYDYSAEQITEYFMQLEIKENIDVEYLFKDINSYF